MILVHIGFLSTTRGTSHYGYQVKRTLDKLTPKGPETIFKHFLKFGQAIVKAIFIKNS
jgi:hypothetical protein